MRFPVIIVILVIIITNTFIANNNITNNNIIIIIIIMASNIRVNKCLFSLSYTQITSEKMTLIFVYFPSFFPSFVFAAFVCSSGTPPTMLNTSNPASATTTGYGSGSPQGASSSVSASAAHLQPFIGNIILVTSFITAKITLEI